MIIYKLYCHKCGKWIKVIKEIFNNYEMTPKQFKCNKCIDKLNKVGNNEN